MLGTSFCCKPVSDARGADATASDLDDIGAAEKPRGAHEQDQQQNRKGYGVLEIRRNVEAAEGFQETESQSADDGAGQAAPSPEHGGAEALEAEHRALIVGSQRQRRDDRPGERAGESGNAERNQ